MYPLLSGTIYLHFRMYDDQQWMDSMASENNFEQKLLMKSKHDTILIDHSWYRSKAIMKAVCTSTLIDVSMWQMYIIKQCKYCCKTLKNMYRLTMSCHVNATLCPSPVEETVSDVALLASSELSSALRESFAVLEQSLMWSGVIIFHIWSGDWASLPSEIISLMSSTSFTAIALVNISSSKLVENGDDSALWMTSILAAEKKTLLW